MNTLCSLIKRCSIILALFYLTGCSDQHSAPLTTEPTHLTTDPSKEASTHKQKAQLTPHSAPLPKLFINNATKQVAQFHQQSQQLQQAIEAFLSSSDSNHWQTLKHQWLMTHESWHLCDFYLLPVRKQQRRYHTLVSLLTDIHSVPVMAGYLDAVDGYPFSGIVNDITVPITEQAIIDQHRRYDTAEVAIGLHAMEFFLWGRSANDYALTTTEVNPSDQQQRSIHRRRQYLSILGHLLVSSSGQLREQWSLLVQQANTVHLFTMQQPVVNSIVNQLQQLDVHSEFHHAQDDVPKYYWQPQAVAQWQHWLIEPPLVFLREQQKQQLTDAFIDLQALFVSTPIDVARLDAQRQYIIDQLQTFSTQATTE